MSLLELKSFVKNVKPFDNLDDNELNELTNGLDIIYFKENEVVLNSEQKPEFLYFIIKGIVQEIDDEEVVSVYTENEYFDPVSLIESRGKNTFLAYQESICYMLPKKLFLKIMYQNEKLERYFFASIADKLNSSTQNDQKKKLLDFATSKVEDAYLQKPIYIDEAETIHNTVKILVENNIQAILVKRKDGEIGIVTDSSFVRKVALKRMDLDGPYPRLQHMVLKQ